MLEEVSLELVLEEGPDMIVSREEDVGGVVEDESVDVDALAEAADPGVLLEDDVVASQVARRAQPCEPRSEDGNHGYYEWSRLYAL